MPTKDDREAIRRDRLATLKTFVIKNAPGPINENDLFSLSRLTDKTLNLLTAAVDGK